MQFSALLVISLFASTSQAKATEDQLARTELAARQFSAFLSAGTCEDIRYQNWNFVGAVAKKSDDGKIVVEMSTVEHPTPLTGYARIIQQGSWVEWQPLVDAPSDSIHLIQDQRTRVFNGSDLYYLDGRLRLEHVLTGGRLLDWTPDDCPLLWEDLITAECLGDPWASFPIAKNPAAVLSTRVAESLPADMPLGPGCFAVISTLEVAEHLPMTTGLRLERVVAIDPAASDRPVQMWRTQNGKIYLDLKWRRERRKVGDKEVLVATSVRSKAFDGKTGNLIKEMTADASRIAFSSSGDRVPTIDKPPNTGTFKGVVQTRDSWISGQRTPSDSWAKNPQFATTTIIRSSPNRTFFFSVAVGTFLILAFLIARRILAAR